MSGAPRGRFSRAGLGVGLASSFDVAVARRQPGLLRGPRGRQLLITCNIGGSQRDQPYETYSFLILDLDRNGDWLAMQQGFRAEVMPLRRRMSFKAMNDAVRRRALPNFLALSEFLDAVLVSFAVHKTDRPYIGVHLDLVAELAGLWKPAVLNRLMWVVCLSAFLVSGFAAPG